MSKLSRRRRAPKKLSTLDDSTDDFKDDNLSKSQFSSSSIKNPGEKMEIHGNINNDENKEASQTDKDYKIPQPNCPFCGRNFFGSHVPATRCMHLKSCARRKGVSTEKLLEVVNLERRQAKEREELGLMPPSTLPPKPKKKPETKKENNQGGADPDLALALALSISESSHPVVQSVDNQTTSNFPMSASISPSPAPSCSTLQPIPEIASSNDATGEPQTATVATGPSKMWLPQINQVLVKRKRNKPTLPTILERRSSMERERITGERVGTILYPDNPRPVEYKTRTWTDGGGGRQRPVSAMLLEIQDATARLWGYTAKQNILNPVNLVASELQAFILSSVEEVEDGNSTITPGPKPVSQQNILRSPNPAKKSEPSFFALSRSFLGLLRQRTSCDLNLICRSEVSLSCHTLIMEARCPKLLGEMIVETGGELTSANAVNNNYVVLTDYASVVVEVVLEYIYGGVFNLDRLTDRGELAELRQLSRRLRLDEMIYCLGSIEVEEYDEDEVEQKEAGKAQFPKDQFPGQDVSGTQALDALVGQFSQLHGECPVLDGADAVGKVVGGDTDVHDTSSPPTSIQIDAELWDSFCHVLTQKQRAGSTDVKVGKVEDEEEVEDEEKVDEDGHEDDNSNKQDCDFSDMNEQPLNDSRASCHCNFNPKDNCDNILTNDHQSEDEIANFFKKSNEINTENKNDQREKEDDDRISFGTPLSDYGIHGCSNDEKDEASPSSSRGFCNGSRIEENFSSTLAHNSALASSPDMFANSDDEDNEDAPVVLSSGPASPFKEEISYRLSDASDQQRHVGPHEDCQTPLSSKRKELHHSGNYPSSGLKRARICYPEPEEELPSPTTFVKRSYQRRRDARSPKAGCDLLDEPCRNQDGSNGLPRLSPGLTVKDLLETIKIDLQERTNVIECLQQLLQMNVSLDDLKSTGIGKVVKKLKTKAGEVGKLSRQVVRQWIELVDRQCQQAISSPASQHQLLEVKKDDDGEDDISDGPLVHSNMSQQRDKPTFDRYSYEHLSPVSRSLSQRVQISSSICVSRHSSVSSIRRSFSSNPSFRPSLLGDIDAFSGCTSGVHVTQELDSKLEQKEFELNVEASNDSNQLFNGEPEPVMVDPDPAWKEPDPVWDENDPVWDEPDPFLTGDVQDAGSAVEPERPKSQKTPVNKRLMQLDRESHVDACTPLPNYETMLSPDLRAELRRYGLKAVPRKKAALFLNHIYNKTHPLVTPGGSLHYPSPVTKNLQKKKRPVAAGAKQPPRTIKPPAAAEKPTATTSTKRSKKGSKPVGSQPPQVTQTEEDEEDFSSSSQTPYPNDVPESTFLGLEEEEDVTMSQVQNEQMLTDKLNAFIKARPSLHQDILLFTPIPLNQLIKDIKQSGIKCKQEEIITFLDKMCINFRFANDRTKKNMSPRKAPKSTKKVIKPRTKAVKSKLSKKL